MRLRDLLLGRAGDEVTRCDLADEGISRLRGGEGMDLMNTPNIREDEGTMSLWIFKDFFNFFFLFSLFSLFFLSDFFSDLGFGRDKEK